MWQLSVDQYERMQRTSMEAFFETLTEFCPREFLEIEKLCGLRYDPLVPPVFDHTNPAELEVMKKVLRDINKHRRNLREQGWWKTVVMCRHCGTTTKSRKQG
ncbi:unnamed protein product [Leptosia nina]|uniref:Uncharacterized protein n=1 Tax=Leptosia nina TaxID=320188 RepID=A0AAV1JZX5_9NEOP